MITYKDAPTAPTNSDLCQWAVCYDIAPENYDDRKPRTGVTATFRDPQLAEDFIRHVLPAETRDRFYLCRIN